MEISIYDYSKYSHFIRDWVAKKKESDGGNFSLGKWARALGLSSTASLSNIVSGRRSPGKDLLTKLCDDFSFEDKESKYFEYLVQIEKYPKGSQEFLELYSSLNNLNPKRDYEIIDDEVFEMISEWYHTVIYQMVCLKNFVEDPTWIAAQLSHKITADQAQKSIDKMIELNLLKREEGRLCPANKAGFAIETTTLPREAYKRHHEAMIDRAKESIREVKEDSRFVLGGSLAIKKEDLPAFNKYVENLIKDATAKFASNEGDVVYRLNTQLFPLTKGENLQ